LDYYKKIEGARQDEKEGQVSFSWDLKAPTVMIDSNTRQIIGHSESNQNISYRGYSMNPYYIVSTSHPDVNKQLLAKKFGYFIVRINDPQALLERIKVAWQQHDWALNDHVVIVPTEYNKDEVLEPNEYLIPPHEYSYCQKPPSFSDEQQLKGARLTLKQIKGVVFALSSPRNIRDMLHHLKLKWPCCFALLFTEPLTRTLRFG